MVLMGTRRFPSHFGMCHFLIVWLLSPWCCLRVLSLQNILVTGAGGRTGQLVVQELLDNPQFTPTAVVRNERSAKILRKRIPRLGLDQIVVCDIVRDASLETALAYDAMVICTSSVPVISQRSLLVAICLAPWNRLTRGCWLDYRRLQFRWKYRQEPEQVDYHGQLRQIAWALQQESCNCIVLVSSMGGTNPDHFLNAVGRRPDGTGGDILLWKRRAELFLAESAMDYVIMHPGGLNDDTEDENQPDFCLGVNDEMYGAQSIARRDVAQLCVAALNQYQPGQRIAFDCVANGASRRRTAEVALQEFISSDGSSSQSH